LISVSRALGQKREELHELNQKQKRTMHSYHDQERLAQAMVMQV
jgi:hypothetical protein